MLIIRIIWKYHPFSTENEVTKDVILHFISSYSKHEKKRWRHCFSFWYFSSSISPFCMVSIFLWFICAIPGNATKCLPLSNKLKIHSKHKQTNSILCRILMHFNSFYNLNNVCYKNANFKLLFWIIIALY